MPRCVTTHVGIEARMTLTRSQQERAGRGGDAKVWVSLNSPADVVNAIIVVIIRTFCKTSNEALICLHQDYASFTFSLQQEEQKGRKKFRKGMNKNNKGQRQSGSWKEANWY